MVTAKIKAKNGEKDKIIEKAQDLIESTRLESGCISYNLFASTEDNNTLMMLEKWENQNVLNSHMQTEHFKEFGKSIEELLAENLKIYVYSVEEFD